MRSYRVIFHIERNYALGKIAIYVAQKSTDGERVAYMKTAIFQETEAAVLPDADPLLVDVQDAQSLMDGLWNNGIRPTDSRDYSDIIKAKDLHIKDLQFMAERLYTLLIPKVR